MSDKLKKTLSIIANVLVILIIVFAVIVTFLFCSAKKNEDIPAPFGYTAFSIQTDSMEKTIKEGDFILGKKCDTKALVEGDIITFFTVNEDGVVFINTHRIVDILETEYGRLFVTKGDKYEENDLRNVSEGDIISKYTGFRIPLLGYVLTFLSTQLGFFICIVFPILIYTIWEVYKLIVIIMHNQKVKMIEEASDATSDAVKEAIIAEYLAKQQEAAKEDDTE